MQSCSEWDKQREISVTRKDLRKMIAKAVRYQMKCDRGECKMITQDGKRFTHKMLLLNRPEPLRTEALGNSTCFLISSVFGGSQKTKRNEKYISGRHLCKGKTGNSIREIPVTEQTNWGRQRKSTGLELVDVG